MAIINIKGYVTYQNLRKRISSLVTKEKLREITRFLGHYYKDDYHMGIRKKKPVLMSISMVIFMDTE
jgi:hypothetical protein